VAAWAAAWAAWVAWADSVVEAAEEASLVVAVAEATVAVEEEAWEAVR